VVQLSGYAWVLAMLDVAGKRVLDVATGTGFGADLLSERARLVVGADLDREAASEARRRYGRLNLSFVQADASALPFGNSAFDLVVSQDTIEHIADDRRFVGEVARVLTPAGTFIVFTPWREEHTREPDNPFHLREYSAATLGELLAAHFSEIRFWGRRWGHELALAEAQLDRVRRLDPLDFRRVIPRAVRHRAASFWLWLRKAKPLDRISVEDVAYVEGAPPGSNTLIAFCRTGS
jgi:SAM-dependent methyltransferase